MEIPKNSLFTGVMRPVEIPAADGTRWWNPTEHVGDVFIYRLGECCWSCFGQNHFATPGRAAEHLGHLHGVFATE